MKAEGDVSIKKVGGASSRVEKHSITSGLHLARSNRCAISGGHWNYAPFALGIMIAEAKPRGTSIWIEANHPGSRESKVDSLGKRSVL